MTDKEIPFVFFPGSGGGMPDLSLLQADQTDPIRFEKINYPGWKRYAAKDFSPESLIAELAAEVEAKIPRGPIRILGLSMGGHFGYAVALHLQAKGREIAGLCAIDAFLIDTAEPTAGWKKRALAEGLELLRQRRAGEFIHFVRSRFWRALLRLTGSRLPRLLNAFSSKSRPASAADPILQRELSLRMLVRAVAGWLAALDHNPVPFYAPATLLRTKLTSGDDDAWRLRCPNIEICDIQGQHHTLFEPENVSSLREAFLATTARWHAKAFS